MLRSPIVTASETPGAIPHELGRVRLRPSRLLTESTLFAFPCHSVPITPQKRTLEVRVLFGRPNGQCEPPRPFPRRATCSRLRSLRGTRPGLEQRAVRFGESIGEPIGSQRAGLSLSLSRSRPARRSLGRPDGRPAPGRRCVRGRFGGSSRRWSWLLTTRPATSPKTTRKALELSPVRREHGSRLTAWLTAR